MKVNEKRQQAKRGREGYDLKVEQRLSTAAYPVREIVHHVVLDCAANCRCNLLLPSSVRE